MTTEHLEPAGTRRAKPDNRAEAPIDEADIAWVATQVQRAKFMRNHIPAMKVTPSLALAMLQRNERNRALSWAHAKGLAEAMKRGEWLVTHEAVAFDRTGRLQDGQHRLHAVVIYGDAITMDVAFGEDPEAFDRINVGKSRTIANLLETRGHKNGNILSACVRLLLTLDEKGGGAFSHIAISRHRVLEFVDAHEDVIESCAIAAGIKGNLRRVVSNGGLAAGIFLIRREMGHRIPAPFFDKLRTGIGFKDENDAVYRLRTKLTHQPTVENKRRTLDQREIAALTIKAFNAWYNEKPVKVLRWTYNAENFPNVGEEF